MNNYVIELIIVHTCLVSGYLLLFRKERQYTTMRFFLLASTFASLIIPLLRLPRLWFTGDKSPDVILEPIRGVDSQTTATSYEQPILLQDIFIWISVSISLILLFKFLKGVFHLIRLAKAHKVDKVENCEGVLIRRVNGTKGSFSFFSWIFVTDEMDSNDEELQAIVTHERAHVSLGHSYDIVFLELFRICFWWMPTSWLIIREIKAIHEFQADARAVERYGVERYSAILMNSVLKSNGLNLTSSFRDNLVLKRLTIMKEKPKKLSTWKLGALGAVCTLLFTVLACSEEPREEMADEGIFTVVESQPEFEGGMGGFRKFIMNEIRYPKEAREKGVEGSVNVRFVVGKTGNLQDVQILSGIDPSCDLEVVRVLREAPAFKPATQNGKEVLVRMAIPITFELQKSKSNKDGSAHGVIVVGDIEPINENMKVEAAHVGGVWKGTVYDEDGEGLPGANIIVSGTTQGTVSDSKGKFTIDTDAEKELAISFVGYEHVRIGGKK